ncbi:hypothetical protein B0O99DRAFT_685458 [Bisporella sp. PMI_857]|nr:hypothetical protein B0O99DRAFT_685458 [Bisporella sp. PMI_857]
MYISKPKVGSNFWKIDAGMYPSGSGDGLIFSITGYGAREGARKIQAALSIDIYLYLLANLLVSVEGRRERKGHQVPLIRYVLVSAVVHIMYGNIKFNTFLDIDDRNQPANYAVTESWLQATLPFLAACLNATDPLTVSQLLDRVIFDPEASTVLSEGDPVGKYFGARALWQCRYAKKCNDEYKRVDFKDIPIGQLCDILRVAYFLDMVPDADFCMQLERIYEAGTEADLIDADAVAFKKCIAIHTPKTNHIDGKGKVKVTNVLGDITNTVESSRDAGNRLFNTAIHPKGKTAKGKYIASRDELHELEDLY